MHPKDAAGMANSVDPDQTAWSALFAGTYLSQYIEFVRYAKRKDSGKIVPMRMLISFPVRACCKTYFHALAIIFRKQSYCPDEEHICLQLSNKKSCVRSYIFYGIMHVINTFSVLLD